MDYKSPKTERQQKAIKQANKIFLFLLGSGLFIGVVVSIGVIKLMNYFGLTENNNQIEIIREKLNQ